MECIYGYWLLKLADTQPAQPDLLDSYLKKKEKKRKVKTKSMTSQYRIILALRDDVHGKGKGTEEVRMKGRKSSWRNSSMSR